jgi:hypothetical protein
LAVGAWDWRAKKRRWGSHVQAFGRRVSHDGQCEKAVREARDYLLTA